MDPFAVTNYFSINLTLQIEADEGLVKGFKNPKPLHDDFEKAVPPL